MSAEGGRQWLIIIYFFYFRVERKHSANLLN